MRAAGHGPVRVTTDYSGPDPSALPRPHQTIRGRPMSEQIAYVDRRAKILALQDRQRSAPPLAPRPVQVRAVQSKAASHRQIRGLQGPAGARSQAGSAGVPLRGAGAPH